MVEKKEIAKKGKVVVSCADRLCPVHGDKKLNGRVVIEFERMLKLPKYERHEKRRTKIHARLPDCMKDEVEVGDLIQIAETRPISKMIHCVVSRKAKLSEVTGDRLQVTGKAVGAKR